jgi:hypothetical protein
LPTHPARASWGADIRRDSHGLELPVSLADCRPDRDPLGTRSHGIRCVFDIHAIDKVVVLGEEAGADPESRVWTVRSAFGRAAA